MTTPPHARRDSTTDRPPAHRTPHAGFGTVDDVTAHFEAPHPFEVTHPHALAVYCSDGRFTQSVEDLLAHIGHGRLDTLTIPGGPAVLNHMSAAYADADVISRAAAFLIKSHAITEVVLLAHEGCGYYRQKRPSDTPEQIFARQIDDLRAAAKTLRRSTPELDVHLYYSRIVEKVVRFEQIALTGATSSARRG